MVNASTLKIALAQINVKVGDIKANTRLIQTSIADAKTMSAELIVFPELSITGYPPEDLLLRKGLYCQVEDALAHIMVDVKGIDVIVGFPRIEDSKVYNSAAYLRDGKIIEIYDKWALPNYSVFDEKRYFHPGNKPCVVDFQGVKLGMTICEDIWESAPSKAAVAGGAQLIININASPFHRGKYLNREQQISQRVEENKVGVVYLNLVGGQDELVFDGASFVMNSQAQMTARFSTFNEQMTVIEIEKNSAQPLPANIEPHPPELQAIYQALVLGVRDYVRKNGFKQVVLGLSGGIDSALALVIAVQALGAENVEAVMLPTRYTTDMSLTDAERLAQNLSVDYKVIAIESLFESFLSLLAPEFEGKPVDATEENIQARIRGLILMAISNKKGAMVLTTGNKSEMAVGYSTLYGDMAGGFDVLKDVPKTLVFALSRYCNRHAEVIPTRIIERPPSAELREDQVDQDSLPPYEILDQILEFYVDQDCSIDEIINQGFDEHVVTRVARMVDINEYKRRQAPPGVRITPKAFGRDRRYPITSGFVDKRVP